MPETLRRQVFLAMRERFGQIPQLEGAVFNGTGIQRLSAELDEGLYCRMTAGSVDDYQRTHAQEECTVELGIVVHGEQDELDVKVDSIIADLQTALSETPAAWDDLAAWVKSDGWFVQEPDTDGALVATMTVRFMVQRFAGDPYGEQS